MGGEVCELFEKSRGFAVCSSDGQRGLLGESLGWHKWRLSWVWSVAAKGAVRHSFMGCLWQQMGQESVFLLFISQFMWPPDWHPWSITKDTQCSSVITPVCTGESKQILLFLLGLLCAHSSQAGSGQGSWRMAGPEEDNSLCPFTFPQHLSQELLCSCFVPWTHFQSGKREGNKASLVFFNIFSSRCPLTSFPSPTVTFPQSNLSLTKFEIKLGIMN